MKKLTRILAVAGFAATTMLSTAAVALDQNVNATVTFQPAITLTNGQAIDFGTVEFTGVPVDTVTVATDDSVSYGGATLTGTGVGVAGEVTITGAAVAVDISCDDTGATVSDGVNSLTLQAAEFVLGSANGVAAGSGNACAGLGTSPVAYTIGSSDDVILFGAQIDTATGTVAAGTYTSALSGNYIQVRAVYQ